MGLGYRNPDKNYGTLLESMKNIRISDANYGKNRFIVAEGKKEVKYENILDPESAESKIKELGFTFDNKEDYGGGWLYTLKGEVVANYDPHFANIAVYQELEKTLPKAEAPAAEAKPDNVIDTNVGSGTVKEGNAKTQYWLVDNEGNVRKEFPNLESAKKYAIRADGKETIYKVVDGQLAGKLKEDVGFSYQNQGQGDQIISQGISDQTVADNIAQKSGGRREIDKDDPNKFMVIKTAESMTMGGSSSDSGEEFSMDPYDIVDELSAQNNYVASSNFDWKEKAKLINYAHKYEGKSKICYLMDDGSDSYTVFVVNKRLAPAQMKKYGFVPYDADDILDEAKEKNRKKDAPKRAKRKLAKDRPMTKREEHEIDPGSGGFNESKVSETPYQSPFQQEGRWSDNLSEDCKVKAGETYKFSDGQEITIDRIEGRTIYVTTADGREEAMQYDEIDQLLHNGELTKIGESKYVAMAEKAILVKYILEKEKITEKEKKFIEENLKIQLSEKERAIVERIVVERYGSLLIKGKTNEKTAGKTNTDK